MCVWNDGEIESLANRLAMYKEELQFHLLVSLRYLSSISPVYGLSLLINDGSREQVDFQTVQQTSKFDALD